MASLSAFQPTADLQPADDILMKLNSKKFDPQIHGIIIIRAKELEIVKGHLPYWKREDDLAELIGVDRLGMVGKKGMAEFAPGVKYCVSFIASRTALAQNLHNITLALEFNGQRTERVVDLMELPADAWTAVKVGDFKKLIDDHGTMTISLADHVESLIWKTGLKIKCILVEPAIPLKN